jgi:hypothetical protein
VYALPRSVAIFILPLQVVILRVLIFYVAEKDAFPLGVDEDEFIVIALNHLARSFQQCRDTQTMDAFSLAMQVSFI